MNSPQAKVMKEVISRMLSKFGYGADNLEVLAEYVTVMIINNKGLEQVNRELGELIGDDYDSTFASALFEELKGGGEPVGDENERSVQEMASTPTPVIDIHQPMMKMEEDSSIRHPIPAEKRVFTSTNARLFSSAIGGVLRDAANSSAAAEEMRQYLEGGEDRDVKLEEEIPTQPAADVRRPRDYPSRPGNGTHSQSRSYHPSSKLKRAPVTSRLGDRMSPYVRPSNQTHGGGPMHRLGGGPGWGPGNGQALAMMNGGFPPMVPDMNMLLSMGIPPGMAMPPGMRPPARMMPMEPSFAQLGPLTVDRQPHDLLFRRNNILTGDPQNEIPNHLRPPSVAGGKRVRCQFWPACIKGSNCQYFHPTRTCTAYPNCPNAGNTCNFIHPDDNPNEAQPPKEPGESLNRVENGHHPISPQPHWQTTQQMPFHPNLLASSVVSNKIPCKFGHACNKPGCPFFHQKQVGSSAPPCKFYPNCTNMSCPFTHPGSNSSKFSSYGEPLAAATSEDVEMEDTTKPSLQELLDRPLSDGPKTSTRSSIPFKKVPIPCRESAACSRPGCHFTHPWDKPEASNVPCRFGPACTRPGCSFQHPRHQNRSATFNKPASEHVSERNFSLSEVQEQILPGGSSIESGEVKSNGAMEVS